VDGKRYEIKARRQTKGSKPTRFSAIRGLEEGHFDYLVALLFTEDFRVHRAAILAREAIAKRAFWQKYGTMDSAFERFTLERQLCPGYYSEAPVGQTGKRATGLVRRASGTILCVGANVVHGGAIRGKPSMKSRSQRVTCDTGFLTKPVPEDTAHLPPESPRSKEQ
jgi:hypothetical protein